MCVENINYRSDLLSVTARHDPGSERELGRNESKRATGSLIADALDFIKHFARLYTQRQTVR